MTTNIKVAACCPVIEQHLHTHTSIHTVLRNEGSKYPLLSALAESYLEQVCLKNREENGSDLTFKKMVKEEK